MDRRWAIFLNGVEQTRFGRFSSSNSAMCALMMSGISGYALNGYSIEEVEDD